MSEVSSPKGNEGLISAVGLALPFPFSTVEKVDTASLTQSSEDEASFAEKASFRQLCHLLRMHSSENHGLISSRQEASCKLHFSFRITAYVSCEQPSIWIW